MTRTTIPALLGTIGLLAAAAPAARAQDASYTLGKVTFQGNNKVPTDELMAALPYQPGQKITKAGIAEESSAVGAAYTKHNVGANITSRATILNHTKLNLTYVIDEQAAAAPVVRHVGNVADSVTVQGNKRISTADILAASKLQPGGPVTNETLAAAQNNIVALYKAKNIGVQVGYDFSKVGTEPGHVAIVFKVQEKADDS